MEKLKFVPMGLFSLYTLKLIIFGASYADSAALLFVAASAVILMIKSNEEKLNQLQSDINSIKQEHENMKTYVNSLKLSQTLRSGGTVNLR